MEFQREGDEKREDGALSLGKIYCFPHCKTKYNKGFILTPYLVRPGFDTYKAICVCVYVCARVLYLVCLYTEYGVILQNFEGP